MIVTKGKFVVVAVLVFMGLTLGTANSSGESNLLDIQGSTPDIVFTPGTAFNITLKITNTHEYRNIAFDRVTLMYVNKDLSFSGPIEGTISGMTLQPGQFIKRTVSFIVDTTQPSGTIIPIMINLFKVRLSTDNESYRGSVVVGAKVQ